MLDRYGSASQPECRLCGSLLDDTRLCWSCYDTMDYDEIEEEDKTNE